MPQHELSLEPELSEIPRLIDWVAARCAETGLEGETVFKMTLALEEAVMNVIDHAFAGIAPPHRIRLRLEVGAERLAAELIDNGRPFDPSAAPAPDLSQPAQQRAIGGLGVHLMRTMTDRVEYRRRGECNHLRLEKNRR